MKAKPQISYLFVLTLIGCSSIWQTVRIEVPKGYIGWVYVIPAADTTGLEIQNHDGRYKINLNGVAYIPAQILNIKKDSRVLAFEEREDISEDMRYAGSVHSVTHDGNKYDYIHFYLPSLEERKIADGTQYWRDKSWQYRNLNKFDSLLQLGKIVFR